MIIQWIRNVASNSGGQPNTLTPRLPHPQTAPAVTRRLCSYITHTHTHTSTRTRLTALCRGLPGSASTRKVKPIWILLKQETAGGSGISWAICKSAPRSEQITTPAPHHSVFACRMPFLPPNQQRRITKGSVPTLHPTDNSFLERGCPRGLSSS